MSKKAKLQAAGAVVLRRQKDHTEVLLVHRPRYDDWSLPKGKLKADEDMAPAAVREVAEETGVLVRLGMRLSSVQYQVQGQRKVVHWWVARVVAEQNHKPDHEVDKIKWLPVDKARKRLNYADEVAVLDEAMATPQTGTVLLVRHGKAMLRKHWTGTDAHRPISARGRRQARRLAALLQAYGTDELLSSSSTRCLQTFTPGSAATGLPITGYSLLSEEEAEGHGPQVRKLMARWARRAGREGLTLAVCGHRPVLPDMRIGLGVEDKPMLTAETLVVHVDRRGNVVSTETVKSAF